MYDSYLTALPKQHSRREKMWTLCLQVVVFCVFLQVRGCYPSCIIVGSLANCAYKNLYSVPALPPHITHLFLEMNRIGEINASSFSNLERLQQLDLGLQHVPLVIRNNTFSKQSHLTRLVLGSNRGLLLEAQAFVGLSSLKNLYLDYCSLNEAILNNSYLEPLTSLETLDLFGNNIKKLQPAMHFPNMINLKDLNLKLNSINQICEADMAGFKGKHFRFMNLNSVGLGAMSSKDFDWGKCGNPFKGMSFEILDLSNINFCLGSLKQFLKAIQGTKINKLKLSGHVGRGFPFNNLPDPDSTTFEGLKHSFLQTLDLSKSSIFALQQGVFSPLEDVKVIDVSQNRVNQIHRNAFDGIQGHLKSLNLSHNLLGEIYSYTFASLTNLRVLDLSHNHIGALGYASFSGLSNLRALFLTGNSIRVLGLPASLPSLDYLKLDDNKLTSVYSIPQFANHTTYLDVSNNKLTNLDDVYMFLGKMKRLQYLFYRNNPIKWCAGDSKIGPNKLKVLYLDRISLQSVWSQGKCLDVFDHLGHLRVLSLTFNSLQSLPSGIFKGLTSVQKVDLSSNALTYLQSDVFPKSLQTLGLADNFIAAPPPEAFQSLRSLDLQMNRFHCGPELKGFLTWMQETNVTFMSPVRDLRCEFPSKLNSVTLLDFSAQITQH